MLLGDVDIIVDMEPATRRERFIKVRKSDGSPVTRLQLLAFDRARSDETLLAMDDLPAALRERDEEIDIEHAGKVIDATSTVAVRDDLEPAFTYTEYDILDKPSGDQVERVHLRVESNVEGPIPVRVTEQYMTPVELLLRFVFRKSYTLSHQDSAGYKLLHDMASRLQGRGQLVRLQAFDQETRKPAPLVLVSGTVGFAAAFLEGKVEGNRYCLMVHLADRELRLPEEVA